MSIYGSILNAVATVVKGLDLPDIRDGNVQVRKLDRTNGLTYPCVVISPTGDSRQQVSNTSDTVTYGVLVTLARTTNQDYTKWLEQGLDWRETVAKAFRPKQGQAVLDGVAAVYDSAYAGGIVISPVAFSGQVDLQTIGFNFFTREARV